MSAFQFNDATDAGADGASVLAHAHRKRSYGEVDANAGLDPDGRGKRVSSLGTGMPEHSLGLQLGALHYGQVQQRNAHTGPAPESFVVGQPQPQSQRQPHSLASPSFPPPPLPRQSSHPWQQQQQQQQQRPPLSHHPASFPSSHFSSPTYPPAHTQTQHTPTTYQVNIHQYLSVPPAPPHVTSAADSSSPAPAPAPSHSPAQSSWAQQRLDTHVQHAAYQDWRERGQQQHQQQQQMSQADGQAAVTGDAYRYQLASYTAPQHPAMSSYEHSMQSAQHQQAFVVPPVPTTSSPAISSYYPAPRAPTTAPLGGGGGGAMYPSHALQQATNDFEPAAAGQFAATEHEYRRRLSAGFATQQKTSPYAFDVPLANAGIQQQHPPPPPQQPYPSPAPTQFPYAHLAAAAAAASPSTSPPSTRSTPGALPILPQTLPALQQASTERAIHRASAPVLAFNPAREQAVGHKQKLHTAFGVTYAVSSSGQSKGKAKSAELGATCWTCALPRAKIILRGHDLTGWTPRLSFTCLDCLPVDEQGRDVDPQGDERRERLAQRAFEADQDDARRADGLGPGVAMGLPTPTEHDRATFEDSFSGAVDKLEGGPAAPTAPGATSNTVEPAAVAAAPSAVSTASAIATTPQHSSRLLLPPEETARGLSDTIKRQALTCDVCDRVIGAGTITTLAAAPVTPDSPPPAHAQAPPYTVEVICAGCEEKYRPCSDCGGGGGRLTPGRWRCKELFPAGRRTCTLSHARNPPLSDIDYDVLRITEIDPAKLDALEARCRLVYWNVRLRTQARPEMLERGDGLATTYAQCEKLTVDGWSLLKPMMSVDVEPTRGLRRYISLQTSTPFRRRGKPRPGAQPRPEPVEPQDPVEKEVSGFLLVEHDMRNGAIFIAVTMPWAISGDAFDATTILIDETIKRIKTDIRHENAVRREHGQELLPEPWCIWGVTPFKADSRMSQSLTRRSFVFLEEYLQEHPDLDLSIFPPHRPIHIPNEFVKTFKIFLRDVTDDDGGEGGPPPPADLKRQPRQRARKLKATPR